MEFFKKYKSHIIAIFTFLLLAIVYFFPQFQGKSIIQSDIVSYKAMSHEAKTFEKKEGRTMLWTNSMFGGMPTFQMGAVTKNNFMRYIEKGTQAFFARPIGYFFAAMIAFYFLLVLMGVSSYIAMIGAIAFAFSTNSLELFEAGHMTKIRALTYIAPVLAGVILTYRKKYFLGVAIYTIAMGIELYTNHIQMTYYAVLAILIFILVQLIYDIKDGNITSFIKASLFLIIGSVFALGTSASKLITSYEYGKETMRGGAILDNGDSKSSKSKGLEWDYAMQWSNGPLDVFATIIPAIAGGGSSEPASSTSALYKDLRSKGARLGKDFKAPYYWGSLPFTSGPAYFGAFIIFMFVLGMIILDTKTRIWTGTAFLFLLLISLGKNFSGMNKILFNLLPLFNNFRSPNSVMGVAQIFAIFPGILALNIIFQKKIDNKKSIKAIKTAFIITVGLILVLLISGFTAFDFIGLGDSRLEKAGYSLDAIHQDRLSILMRDAFRSIIIIVFGAGLIWLLIKDKLKANVFVIGLIILNIFDFWGVGMRYLNSDDFVSNRKSESMLRPRKVDTQIKQDKDIYYRVHDVTRDPFNSAIASYHHHTIGGYHPAKLQRYQDLISGYLSKGKQEVFNMLNTKYFIMNGQDNTTQVQQNPGALGNAWFINNFKNAPDNNKEFAALDNTDFSTTAIVNKEFESYISGLNPTKDGIINLTKYSPDRLEYVANANGDQFAVFSDIWYNKGWKAYIDDKEVDYIRVNYLLRGLKVPSGKHKIIFEFRPSSWFTGELISLISSVLILLFAGFSFWKAYKKNLSIE